MLFNKRLNKTLLTSTVIASSIFLAPNAFAVRQVINGSDVVGVNLIGIFKGVDFQTDNKLTVNNNENIGDTNNISIINSSGADSQGTLRFDGRSTVNGSITPSGNKLKSIEINTPAFNLVELGFVQPSKIVVDNIRFVNAGQVNIGKNTDISTTKITTTVNEQGLIIVRGNSVIDGDIGEVGKTLKTFGTIESSNGTFTLNGKIYSKFVVLDGKATGIFNGEVNATDIFQIDANNTAKLNANATAATANNFGTLDLGSNKLTATTLYDQGANSKLIIALASTTKAGQVDALTNGATINATSTIEVQNNVPITNGSFYDIILSNAPIATNVPNLSGSNLTYGYTLSKVVNNLRLTVNRTSLSNSSASLNNPSVGGLLNTLDGLVDSGAIQSAPLDLIRAVNGLETSQSGQQLANSAETMTPFADGSLRASSFNAVFSGVNSVANHLHSLRLPNGNNTQTNSGTNSGDGWKNYPEGSWGQALGSYIKQSQKEGVSGYDGTQLGAAVGHDWDIYDNLKLGLAFNYNYTDLESDRIGLSTVHINTYNGIFYGSYFTNSDLYLDFALSLAYHDYDTKRNILVYPTGPNKGLSTIAEADFDAWQLNIWAEAGYQVWDNNWLIVPHVFAQYSRLYFDEYTESGANGLNLRVNYDDMDSQIVGAGMRFAKLLNSQNYNVMPYLKLAITYDLENDSQVATSTLVGGGAPFTTKGADFDKLSFIGALGIDWQKFDNIFFSLKYEMETKDSFIMHGGYAKFRYHWN